MLTEIKETFEELKARKKAELEGAIERGEVAEPISLSALFVSLAVSAAISTASYFVSRALTPKQRFQQGKLSGSLQLQNSEQGLMIPEIYGASPDVSLTAGSNPTYQNVTNCSTGAGGALTKNAGGSSLWNAGASHNVSVTAGHDAFFEFTVGTGYAAAGFATTATPLSGATDFKYGLQWNPDGSVTIRHSNTLLVANATTWATGDRFRVELRSGRFRAYKGSAEIRPQNFVPPTPTYPLWMGVGIQIVGAGITEAKVKIDNIGLPSNAGRGGVKVPAIIVWTSGIRKNVSTTEQPTGGGKGGGGGTATVENTTYDIDLGLMWGRGPNRLLREYANADVLIDQVNTSLLPSGVYDPGTGADPSYDPTTPPDPTQNYPTVFARVDADIPYDVDNVGSGTIQGGGSLFTIYEGNSTQDPDPTIEADIDAKYGAGSTPAYRNHSLIVHKNFLLSRWGGIVPNMTAVWEHTTLKTLDDIYASLTERVGLISSDYDYSDLSGIDCRGLLIAGRLFSPAEIIDSEEIQTAYSYFVTEGEGQILGYAEGLEPSITISDTEVGWLDSDQDLPDVVPEVESRIAQETTLARQIDVKFIDPDNQWDVNTQSAKRQITDGVGVQLLEVQLCLLADEARATAQRKLYKDYVAGTAHKFTLPYTYLYLYPGYKVTINRAEGFTHVLRLTSISGGVGILECEGVALEPETYNQPATGAFNGLPDPHIDTPAMTVITLLDIPLIRDGDATFNDGLLQYVVGTPRTGFNQSWRGFALYISRLNQWQPLITSDVPGTIGTVVSATSLSTNPDVIDHTGVIVVDIYGTTAILSSVAEADIELNFALAGNMIFNFASATRIAGFPNRWQLEDLLNGQQNTVPDIATIAAGDRFVLLNDAVKLVPMEESDLAQTRSYRAITSGQSLGDAATVTHVWEGISLKPDPVQSISGAFDLADDSLTLEWVDNLNAPLADDTFELVIRSAANGGGTVKRGPTTVKPLDLARATSTPPLASGSVSSDPFIPLESVTSLSSTVYDWIAPGGFTAHFTKLEHNGGNTVALAQSALFSLGANTHLETQVPLLDIEPTINENILPSFIGLYSDVGNYAGWFRGESITELLDVTPSTGGLGFPTPPSTYTAVPGDRLSVLIQADGTVVYYVNYLGATSDPWWVSPIKLDLLLQYRVFFYYRGTFVTGVPDGTDITIGVRNTRWLRNIPEFNYTGAMQEEDNSGSLPATVHVGVRKKSSHPLGPASDWLYASFTRP
jgi:hypothetical protein